MMHTVIVDLRPQVGRSARGVKHSLDLAVQPLDPILCARVARLVVGGAEGGDDVCFDIQLLHFF